MRVKILKYLLIWLKERIIDENPECPPEQSRIVDCIDYLLEELNHAKI